MKHIVVLVGLLASFVAQSATAQPVIQVRMFNPPPVHYAPYGFQRSPGYPPHFFQPMAAVPVWGFAPPRAYCPPPRGRGRWRDPRFGYRQGPWGQPQPFYWHN